VPSTPLADPGQMAAEGRSMPDSFGKRQRDQVKARKAAARDERRVARAKRRKEGSSDTAQESGFGDPWGIAPAQNRPADAASPSFSRDSSDSTAGRRAD